jgi:hypothetical protein
MARLFSIGCVVALGALPSLACSNHADPEGPIPWIGHTYMLSLTKGEFTVPKHIGNDLFGIAPTFFFKVDGSGKELTATLATGPGTTTDADMMLHARTPEDAVQDTCGPTTVIPFSGADYPHSVLAVDDNRLFLLDPVTPPLQVTADVYGLTFTDVLPTGDTPSTTGTLAATMDFEQIVVLFGALGPTRTAESVCQVLYDEYTPSSCTDPSCEVRCTACPTAPDSQTCLGIQAEDLGALQAPNVSIVDVTEADRSATCADSQIQ